VKKDNGSGEKKPPREGELSGAVVEYRHPGMAVGVRDALTEVLRSGAQELLRSAIEAEVAEFLARHGELKEGPGRQRVVRNGYLPEREIQTGIGAVKVKAPRVRDRAGTIKFSSAILPRYLRRSKSMEELLPWLYLKGISTNDFGPALTALLGPEAPGLSAASISRYKEVWKEQHESWSTRDLKGKNYVYFWVDGVHFNVRLEDARQCILVVIGATAEGKKELVALTDGVRESEASWKDLLLDLRRRGLEIDPKLAVGDGALGFWKALPQVFGTTRGQRCWVHKTKNVLNYLPVGLQEKGKQGLHQIWLAESRAEAHQAFDTFLATYAAKYPKATDCLERDRAALLAFYDFPAEHWLHLRTSNPIESTFATVRLRTSKTRGCVARAALLAMVFKLTKTAEQNWRTLKGHKLLAEVVRGVVFKDGLQQGTQRIAA
jgi:putative transposase